MRMTTGSSYNNHNGLRSPSIPVYRPGMPCPKHSPFEFRNAVNENRKLSWERSASLDSRTSPARETAPSSASSSSSSRINISLSTPSPSARADGGKVDAEIEKLRRLSEEWVRAREIEESENTVDFLRSRTPSPSRSLRNYFRRSGSVASEDNSSRSSRSPSPQKSTSVSPPRSLSSPPKVPQSNRRPSEPHHITRASPVRSASPTRHSYRRSSSYDRETSPDNFRTGSLPREDPSSRSNIYRRSSSYEGEPQTSPQKFYSLRSRSPSPLANIYRRSNSYDIEEKLRNFRSRSTSPQRLTPASSYYRRSSRTNEENENYDPRRSERSRSPSPQTVSLLNNIFRRSSSYEGSGSPRNHNILNQNFNNSYDRKFNTLPRSRSSPQRSSLDNNPYLDSPSKRDYNSNNIINRNVVRKLAYNGQTNGFSAHKLHNRPTLPTRNSLEINDPFLPYTLPELPSYRMPSTQRRFSDEDSGALRRPLATLHEDEIVNRRKFSNDIRRQSYDSDGSDEYYRRLSEAGIRKLSDASVVLNEDTDSFIIGDRVWVGGTKPGVISYIGETQFAPGDWAGVTLDDDIGKNDGSVGGVRYFQCEQKKGVFSRLTRLSRTPLSEYDFEYLAAKTSTLGSDSPKSYSTPTPSTASGPVSSSAPARKVTPTSQSTPANPPRKITPQSGDPTRRTSTGNGTQSFSKSGSPAPSSASVRKTSGPTLGDVQIGDRVIINSSTGVKWGLLRYVGRTEFAEGVWGGVELEDAIGKNDGSVAGKKYFACRPKYGIFAPIGRIGRYPSSNPPRKTSGTGASTASRSIQPIRRSGSRESLGASSAASSTVSSSLKGTRRPSRTSTGSTSSTKALQETLAEKTQHVEQLMQERDMERGEVARMATHADEATRFAQDLKVQHDQLQIESEERIHDLGEKIKELEGEKKAIWAKLDDKRKEVDDLAFRIEEESLAKADLETQSITLNNRIKELEGSLEKEETKNKTQAAKEADMTYEMEETEISLRASVEEFQSKVMDLEQDKENLELKVEQLEEKVRQKEAENASHANSIIEKDQKINLLESTNACEEVRSREKSAEVSHLEQKIKSLQLEVEKKSKDYQDISQQAEEFLDDLEKEKSNKESLVKELSKSRDIQTNFQQEISQLKDLTDELEIKLKTSQEENVLHEDKIESLQSKMSACTDSANNSSNKLESTQKEVKERELEISSLKDDLKKSSEMIESFTKSFQEMEEQSNASSKCIKELSETISRLENVQKQNEEDLNSKSSTINNLKRELTDSHKKIEDIEQLRKRLENQLETALSTSTSSSDQLKELNQQLRETETKLSSSQEAERLLSTQLAKENESHLFAKTIFEKESEELRVKHDQAINLLKENLKTESERSTFIVNEKEAKIQALSAEKEEMNQRYSEKLKLESENLKNSEADKTRLIHDLEQLKNSLNQFKKDAESRFESDSTKLKVLEEENSVLLIEKETGITKIEDLNKTIDKKDEHISRLQKNQDGNASSLEEKEQMVKTLATQVEIMQKQLSSYREELERQVAQAQADQKEMAFLKSSLDAEHKNLVALEADLELTKAESGKLIEEKSKLIERVDKFGSVEEEKLNLTNKLEGEVKQFEELKDKHEKLVKERDMLLGEAKKIPYLMEEQEKNLSQISQLEEKLQDSLKIENELTTMKDHSKKLETDFISLTEENENLKIISQEHEKAKDENKSLQNRVATLSESLKEFTSLESANQKLRNDFESLQQETQSKLESKEHELNTLRHELNTLRKLEGDHAHSLEMITAMQKDKTEAEDKYLKLQTDLKTQLDTCLCEKDKLATQVSQLQKNLEDVKNSSKATIENIEAEKHNLIEEVVSFEKEASALREKLEVSSLSLQKLQSRESEESEVAQLRLKLITIESDRRNLQIEIKGIKEKLAIYQEGNSQENEFVINLKDERDQLEGQVNFLNSVIVDMQRNKEEMLIKIDSLQSGATLPQGMTSVNGVKETRKPPRMFCDICDCFDLHETEDCPKQANTEESPPPSRHHGERSAPSRPYCDSCEVFGHENDNCPEETY